MGQTQGSQGRSVGGTRLSMQMEILALRHQLAVYQRAADRPRIQPADRIFRAWLKPEAYSQGFRGNST